MPKKPSSESNIARRMMIRYLKHVDTYHSDAGLAETMPASEPDVVAAMVDTLGAVALKRGLVRRVGEQLELTKRGSFLLPDPTRNL